MTICLALAVSVTTWKVSPTSGSDSRPSTSTGVDGSASRNGVAAVVEHGADLAEHRAADEVVADAQRAVAHQHGGHRAAAAVELGFEHRADGRTRRVGLQVLHVGHQQNHFEQQIEIRSWSWPRPAP